VIQSINDFIGVQYCYLIIQEIKKLKQWSPTEAVQSARGIGSASAAALLTFCPHTTLLRAPKTALNLRKMVLFISWLPNSPLIIIPFNTLWSLCKAKRRANEFPCRRRCRCRGCCSLVAHLICPPRKEPWIGGGATGVTSTGATGCGPNAGPPDGCPAGSLATRTWRKCDKYGHEVCK